MPCNWKCSFAKFLTWNLLEEYVQDFFFVFSKKGNLVDHASLHTKLGYLCNLQLILYGKPSYSKRWKTKQYQIRWKKRQISYSPKPGGRATCGTFFLHKKSLGRWQDNTKNRGKILPKPYLISRFCDGFLSIFTYVGRWVTLSQTFQSIIVYTVDFSRFQLPSCLRRLGE